MERILSEKLDWKPSAELRWRFGRDNDGVLEQKWVHEVFEMHKKVREEHQWRPVPRVVDYIT